MRPWTLLPLLLALGCGGSAGSKPSADKDDGFVPLFNGTDLSGWARVNCAPETFKVTDGVLVVSGKPTGVLRTERMYENYIVEFDWMHLKKGGNAGFFVHSGALPVKGQPFTKGHEIQVIDGDDPKGSWTGHGDVFSIHGATFVPDRPHPGGWMRCLPSEKRANPAGQWNHYKVTCNDGSIKLEVNGKEVSGGTKANPRKGYLCVESEGAPANFRNMRIKELPSTNPAADQIAEEDQGFQSLYTGIDLRGWTGEGWTPKDWVLEGSAGASPLTSERQLQHFILVFDWRSAKNGTVTLKLGDAEVRLSAEAKEGQWDRIILSVQKAERSITQNGKQKVEQVAGPASPQRLRISATGDKIQFANLFLSELK